MTLMQRRRALMGIEKEIYPEQEIGYNLLLDVENFQMINKNNPSSLSSKRWPCTADFIPINPNYLYKVGTQNTNYHVYCYDANKQYINHIETSYHGGNVSLINGTRYVLIALGYTDSTISFFEDSIDNGNSYFKRYQ